MDDALVDVENVLRRLKALRAERSAADILRVIIAACNEVRSGVVVATLVVVPVPFCAAVCPARHRRPAVRSAGRGVHHLDSVQPVGGADGDAGAVPTGCRPPWRRASTLTAGWCASSSAWWRAR